MNAPMPPPIDRLEFYRRELIIAKDNRRLSFWFGIILSALSLPLFLIAIPAGAALLAIGLTLLVISQLLAIQVAVRETHLEEARRKEN